MLEEAIDAKGFEEKARQMSLGSGLETVSLLSQRP